MLNRLQFYFRYNNGTELTISQIANSNVLKMCIKTQPNIGSHPIITEFVVIDLEIIEEIKCANYSIPLFYSTWKIDNVNPLDSLNGIDPRNYNDYIARRLPFKENLQMMRFEFELDFEYDIPYDVILSKNEILSCGNENEAEINSVTRISTDKKLRHFINQSMKINFQNI